MTTIPQSRPMSTSNSMDIPEDQAVIKEYILGTLLVGWN